MLCSSLYPVKAKQPQDTGAFGKAIGELLEDKDGKLAAMAETLLGKHAGDKLFYFPTHDEPYTPAKYGFSFESVFFKSLDGTLLHGWFLPAVPSGEQKAKATIVFSHGNAASIAYHFGFVSWLVNANYNVFLYDYRGFGKSKGVPQRKGMIEDVVGAFNYVRTRKKLDSRRLISFSHSLGGAKSLTALALYPVSGLRAIIAHAPFASYQQMAEEKARGLGKKLTSDSYSPIHTIQKLPAHIPLLLIHGTCDPVIPISQSQALYDKAHSPKFFWKVKGANHQDSLARQEGAYRKKLLKWLEHCLQD